MTGDFQTVRRLWISFLERLSRMNFGLAIVVAILTLTGFMTLFSAGYSYPWRVADQARNILIAFFVLILFANVHPRYLMKLAVPLYAFGVFLLLATLVIGTTIKGATRWLNIGITQIQPSELMKVALPMMLAWYFHSRQDQTSPKDFAIAFLIIGIPVALIMKQPDLGTAILVAAAGLSVVFFAGLPWKWILIMVGSGLASLPLIWNFLLHDYQRQRVLTLIDPTSDPLGKGFHTLQALIAIGSGGVFGKGWMEGTQAHLDFIPERTSDFLFAVFSEEFGLIGNLFLLVMYFDEDRHQRVEYFLEASRRRHHRHLLHVHFCEHGHGERHSAGGRCAAALHELRRHGAYHSRHLHRNADGHIGKQKI